MRRIIIAVLVLLAAAGGYFGYQKLTQPDPTKQVVRSLQPLFVPLDRFIISLETKTGSRYLVIEASLVTHDESAIEYLEQARPLLNNVLVTYFAGRNRDETRAIVAKIAELQTLLAEMFNNKLTENEIAQTVEQVLITNIFIQ